MTSGMLRLVAADETPEQADVIRRLRRVAAARKRAAEQEGDLIREATELGVKQADIARALDRSREHIRITLDPSKRRVAGHG